MTEPASDKFLDDLEAAVRAIIRNKKASKSDQLSAIGHGDFGIRNVLRLHVFLKPLDHSFRVGADSVIDLHLQNQVGAALQVKAEIDPVFDALCNPVPAQT